MVQSNKFLKSVLIQGLSVIGISLFLLACGGGEAGDTPDLSSSQKTLTIEIDGNGGINDGSGTIDCQTDCSEKLDNNVTVELTATATAGFTFQQWNGACSGTSTCQVVMSNDKTVAAVFVENTTEPVEYRLTVTKVGGGAITSSPTGINCGIDCNEDYLENTQVNLQATPDAGFVFDGWSGDCSGSSGCNVSMNSSKTISAVFVEEASPDNFLLTVNLDGSGTITSNPSGINCGADCSQEFQQGSQVTLTATPSNGFVFDGWSGACTGTGSCSFSINANSSVTASFTEEAVGSFRLTTSVSGQGAISSTPGGISCGSDCAEDYSENTQVTLQATADEGFSFNAWSGACSGSGGCVVTMDSAKSVSADFVEDVIENFDLTVTVTGPGRVTSSPNGIDCDGDCTESYTSDIQVTLTAVADAGFVLDHWEGACGGNNSCSFQMSETRSVTAVFAEQGSTAVLIENYTPQGDAFQLGEIPNNASGITWHEELQQYLVVRNGSALIYRFDVNFAYMGQIRVNGINTDTEGLGYVAGNEVMIVSEDNYASKITIDANTSILDGDVPSSQRYRVMSRGGSNKGMEGVAVRKATGSQLARVYVCQEGTGGNNMRVAYFDMPDPDPMVLLDYASNLTVIEPFDADQAFSGAARDLAGLMYDDRTGHLIIVSQESRKAIQVDPDTGAIISTLGLSGAPQFEGVTLGPNKELVFVSEGNWIRIYEQN